MFMDKLTNDIIAEVVEFNDEIRLWETKFIDLMSHYWNASAAIVKYYVTDDYIIDTCPLGDAEYESLGKEMRTNPAAFIAAERSGLLADGVSSVFTSSMDTYDNWAYNAPVIKEILSNSDLSRYVSYTDRCFAEAYLSGGDLLREEDDLWYRFYSETQACLNSREERGF